MITAVLLELDSLASTSGEAVDDVSVFLDALMRLKSRSGEPIRSILILDAEDQREAAFERLSLAGLRDYFEPFGGHTIYVERVPPASQDPTHEIFAHAILITSEPGVFAECNEKDMACLLFGREGPDCVENWREALAQIVVRIAPKEKTNLATAIGALNDEQWVAEDSQRAKVHTAPSMYLREWHCVAQPDLGELTNVFVPVVRQIGLSDRAFAQEAVEEVNADLWSDLTAQLKSLKAHNQIEGFGGQSIGRRGPTHRIKTDPLGRKYLTRMRYSGS